MGFSFDVAQKHDGFVSVEKIKPLALVEATRLWWCISGSVGVSGGGGEGLQASRERRWLRYFKEGIGWKKLFRGGRKRCHQRSQTNFARFLLGKELEKVY